jgi:hypothetical protein
MLCLVVVGARVVGTTSNVLDGWFDVFDRFAMKKTMGQRGGSDREMPVAGANN